MPTFRSTVWILTSAAEAVYGDEGITRRIIQKWAPNEEHFKASIMDRYAHTDVDCSITFGPITRKEA